MTYKKNYLLLLLLSINIGFISTSFGDESSGSKLSDAELLKETNQLLREYSKLYREHKEVKWERDVTLHAYANASKDMDKLPQQIRNLKQNKHYKNQAFFLSKHVSNLKSSGILKQSDKPLEPFDTNAKLAQSLPSKEDVNSLVTKISSKNPLLSTEENLTSIEYDDLKLIQSHYQKLFSALEQDIADQYTIKMTSINIYGSQRKVLKVGNLYHIYPHQPEDRRPYNKSNKGKYIQIGAGMLRLLPQKLDTYYNNLFDKYKEGQKIDQDSLFILYTPDPNNYDTSGP